MTKEKQRMEFRYYEMPAGEYVLPKIGRGWEQEYGLGYDQMLHFHNLLEIGYCYDGDGFMIISGKEYRYQGGNFTIIPENIPHTTISAPGHICKWEFLFVDVEAFLRDVLVPGQRNRDVILAEINRDAFFFEPGEEEQLRRIVRFMIEECREQKDYYQQSLKGSLYILMTAILRLGNSKVRIESEESSAHGQGNYIDQAIRYISSNYQEDLRASDIAASCGLSESHFRRMFESSMNMKPMDFLNLVRIREACRLIEREEIPIRDVGYKVGYMIPSTFNRNFRKLTGMTPISWKKEKGKAAGFFRNFRISARKGWEGIDFLQEDQTR